MKKVIASLVAAMALFGFISNSDAVTVTNADGTVFTVSTQGDGATDVDAYQDVSSYPHQGHREGLIVRDYVFARDGAVEDTTIQLGPPIPANTRIMDGWVDVITPVGSLTNSYALSITSADDILAAAATNSLSTDRDIIPNDSVATAITLATNTYLNFTVVGSANTSGIFRVYMPCLYVE